MNLSTPIIIRPAQPLLLRDYLHPFAGEITTYAGDDVSLVAHAAVFGKCFVKLK